MRLTRFLALLTGIACLWSGIAVGRVASKNATVAPNHKGTNVSEFRVDASFPEGLVLQNLQDWESFEAFVFHNAMSRLVRFRGNVATPDLARGWDVSADMLTYTFFLREDALFSDGTPIAAKDVLFSIKRHFIQNGQYAYRLLPALLGHEKLKIVSDPFDGLTAPNSHTVVFRLREPRTTLIEEMSKLSFGIFKENNVAPTTPKIDSSFVASGPYMIREMNTGGITLELNPHHWTVKENKRLVPQLRIIPTTKDLSRIRLAAGEVDFAVVNDSLADWKKLRESGFGEVIAGPNVTYFASCFQGPTLSRFPSVARDINLALDRKVVTERMNREDGHNYVPGAFVTAGIESLIRSEETRISDAMRQEARERLRKVFSSPKNASLVFKIAIAESTAKNGRRLVELFADQLKSIGVRTEIKPMPFSAITSDAAPGIFDMSFISHGLDAKTPGGALQFLAGTSHEKSGLSATHPLFQFYKKIPLARKHEEHLDLVRQYNGLNLETGFIVPLTRSNYYNVFSPKFDISSVPPFEGNWRMADVRLK